MIRLLFLLLALGITEELANAQQASVVEDINLRDQPTFIDADSLTLKSKERIFLYSGNVIVKNGDMTLVSDALEGTYSEQNEIQTLTALKNVVITKGEKLKANSNKAFYEAKTQIVTLTENPQIEQEGSLITADVIKLFLEEDRSVAEGQVRMKVIKVQPTATPTPDPSASPTPASAAALDPTTEPKVPDAPTPTPTQSGFWPF